MAQLVMCLPQEHEGLNLDPQYLYKSWASQDLPTVPELEVKKEAERGGSLGLVVSS